MLRAANFVFILVFILSSSAQAQPLYKYMMHNDSFNLFEVFEEAERYFSKNDKGKGETLKDISGDHIEFDIYPNPASSELTISIDQIISHDYSIEVVDMLGRIIFSTSPTNQELETISVESLHAGMYMIRIIDEAGNYAVRQFTKS